MVSGTIKKVKKNKFDVDVVVETENGEVLYFTFPELVLQQLKDGEKVDVYIRPGCVEIKKSKR